MTGNRLGESGEKAFNVSPFSPSSLNDPVALETEWTPAAAGGASFRTRALRAAGPVRMEFRASWGARLFSFAFVLGGFAVFGGFIAYHFSRGHPMRGAEAALAAGIGAVLVLAGTVMLARFSTPIVFDKRSGYFWKGRTPPDDAVDGPSLEHGAKLQDIHALQLLAEEIDDGDSFYGHYELNLVLKDGGRRHVAAHGDPDRLTADALALGEFLEVPVWNAVDYDPQGAPPPPNPV